LNADRPPQLKASVGWLLSCNVARKESEAMDEELQGKPSRRRPQTFRLGDTVRIVSGPFVSFTGEIEGINQDKALLKVKVAIYGRNNPIKLNFSDVEKVAAP
jgi:transcriptional antiterminator NusG